jgi:hypothetical protein
MPGSQSRNQGRSSCRIRLVRNRTPYPRPFRAPTILDLRFSILDFRSSIFDFRSSILDLRDPPPAFSPLPPHFHPASIPLPSRFHPASHPLPSRFSPAFIPVLSHFFAVPNPQPPLSPHFTFSPRTFFLSPSPTHPQIKKRAQPTTIPEPQNRRTNPIVIFASSTPMSKAISLLCASASLRLSGCIPLQNKPISPAAPFASHLPHQSKIENRKSKISSCRTRFSFPSPPLSLPKNRSGTEKYRFGTGKYRFPPGFFAFSCPAPSATPAHTRLCLPHPKNAPQLLFFSPPQPQTRPHVNPPRSSPRLCVSAVARSHACPAYREPSRARICWSVARISFCVSSPCSRGPSRAAPERAGPKVIRMEPTSFPSGVRAKMSL